MQLVLAHVVVNECLKLKLPLLVLCRKRLDDLYLFCCPFLLWSTSYHYMVIAFDIYSVRALLLFIIIIERYFPDACV